MLDDAVKNYEGKSSRHVLLQFLEEEDRSYKTGSIYFSKHSALVLFVYFVIHYCYAFKTLTNAEQATTVKRFATILLVDTSALVMRDIN